MSQTLSDRPAAGAASDEQVFVTLTVADQLCGVAALNVRDILGEQILTRVPMAPREIAGSLNLRGRIVTAVDLRRRLNLPDAPPGMPRMSVVAELGGELYALLVDQVSEVISLPASAFERNPPTLPPPWSDFSVGIFRLQNKLLVVLDTARLIGLPPAS